MRVCTNEQMRSLDRLTIEKYGVLGELLMERAGRWVAVVVGEILRQAGGTSAVAVCGRGNNGGDGFVAARYLAQMGFRAEIVLAADPESLKGDALLNFKRAQEAQIPWRRFDGTLPKADVIIDALLGTGISGAPRGEIADAIERINEANSIVVSVDIPSGVNGDDGTAPGSAVEACATVTFAFPKLGHFVHPGRAKTGKLYVAKIGIDRRAEAEVEVTYEFGTLAEVAELLPHRPPDGHKGTFGKGLVVAGSQGMTGAAVMASLAFLRSGAGLCYVAVPRSLVDVVDGAAREAVVLPMPEVRKKRCHTLRALGELHKYARTVDAVAVGPGLGRHHETAEMVRRFLVRLQKPVVIDADGLNALAGHANDVIPQITAPSVMTPHVAELARLLDTQTELVANQRIQRAREWAQFLFTTLVVKGNPSVVAAEGKPIWINPTGNDGMATGGSGDVLTGLVAGFLAQGLQPFDAARLGTYIHGLAGDIAAQFTTKRALIAGDLIDFIPDAFAALEAPIPQERTSQKELGFKYVKTYLGAGIEHLAEP